MAAKKSSAAAAAEAELQKAEAEYIKLHPLASVGTDVSPVTRGELRIILEDLLTQLGKAAPASDPGGIAPGSGLSELGLAEMQAMGRDGMLAYAKEHHIDVSAVEGIDDDKLLADLIVAARNAQLSEPA